MRIPKRKAEMDRLALQKDEPIYLTKKGLESLKNKLARTITSIPALRTEMQDAQAMGDLSENAAYSIAKGRLRGAQTRILSIQEQLKIVEIIEMNTDGRVRMGCTVTIKLGDNPSQIWKLVGERESNPGRGYISQKSPLAAAMAGMMAGESTEFNGMTLLVENVE